jgi:hypothetical protein
MKFIKYAEKHYGSIKCIDYLICYCITIIFLVGSANIFELLCVTKWRSLTEIVDGSKNTNHA